jgi:hypothetical protein
VLVVAVAAGVILTVRARAQPPAPGKRHPAAPAEKAAPGPTDLNGVSLSYWPDACQLVSSAEVSAAFGGAQFLPPQPGSGRMGSLTLPLPTACEHQSTDYRLGATVDVTLMSVSKTAAQAARSFTAGKNIGDTAPTALSGIGEQAVWYGGAMPRVRVQQRRVVYQVGVALIGAQAANAPDREQREVSLAEALARIAATRVP